MKCNKKHLFIIIVIILPIPHRVTAESCCKYKNYDAIYCNNSNLNTIPRDLNESIKILNLSSNNLMHISSSNLEKFQWLEKLFIIDCGIETINKNAFKGLKNIIEIDLSLNQLKVLDNDLFSNLLHLKILNLSHNEIYTIGTSTFTNLPLLKELNLSKNSLRRVELETFSSLEHLTVLDLSKNPLQRDCYLQPFHDWTIKRGLCNEIKISEIKWSDLKLENIVCKPTIQQLSQNIELQVGHKSVLFFCRAFGNPIPNIIWKKNDAPLTDSNYTNTLSSTRKLSNFLKISEVTIYDVKHVDYGEYICVAENIEGSDSKSIFLTDDITVSVMMSRKQFDLYTWVIIVSMVANGLTVIILIFLLLYLCNYINNKRNIRKKLALKTDYQNKETLKSIKTAQVTNDICLTSLNDKPAVFPEKCDASTSTMSDILFEMKNQDEYHFEAFSEIRDHNSIYDVSKDVYTDMSRVIDNTGAQSLQILSPSSISSSSLLHNSSDDFRKEMLDFCYSTSLSSSKVSLNQNTNYKMDAPSVNFYVNVPLNTTKVQK